MITEVDLQSARRDLSDIIERARKGETFIITRYGRGVAYIGPIPNPDPRLEKEKE